MPNLKQDDYSNMAMEKVKEKIGTCKPRESPRERKNNRKT